MTPPVRCAKCSRPLAERTGPGRPALYCSTACRRSAEYELRRVQAALEDVEGQLRATRLGWYGRTEADRVKFDAIRAELEARLLVLLGGEQ